MGLSGGQWGSVGLSGSSVGVSGLQRRSVGLSGVSGTQWGLWGSVRNVYTPVEKNDHAHGTYNTNSHINFENSMLKPSFCDYSDEYILVTETITVVELAADRRNNGIEVLLKNCAPFTDYISEINNTQIDNAKDINVVMPMYNLIENNDNYSKASGGFWKYYRDEPALTDTGAIDNFPGKSVSFKLQTKITGLTGDDGTKDVKIMMPMKHLRHFFFIN